MAVDIREISLTEEQKRRIAELAEQTGQSWREVLDEHLKVSPRNDSDNGGRASDDPHIRDKNKRIAFFRQWLTQQTSYNPNFDDSRENIYPDCA
jgi:hypothetical protein